MSKTIRHENTGRHDYKARLNAMRGFAPLKPRDIERMREKALDALSRKPTSA